MPDLLAPIVVHALLVRDGRILLARRAGTGYEDGRWSAPGGHLEPGETLAAAAARECLEEVGVTVAPDAFVPIGMAHYVKADAQGIDVFLRADAFAGEPHAAAECDALGWFAPGDLPAQTIPFVRHAIARHLVDGVWFDEVDF